MCLVDRGEFNNISPQALKEVDFNSEYDYNLGKDRPKLVQDALSIATYHTKIVLFTFAEFFESIQRCPFFRIVTKTTQPAHLLLIIAVTIIAFLLLPNNNQSENVPSVFLAFCYLACYAIHLGSQVWMTFVSGLSLYFTLPRHTFGSVQKVLFPRYFTVNSILSFLTMAAFLKNNNSNFEDFYLVLQGLTLIICFLVELLIRLYRAPRLIALTTEMHTMEAAHGIGLEVGRHNPGNLANCPHYVKIHKNFRKVHMTIAIGNMVTMACSIIHLHYLAQKICKNL